MMGALTFQLNSHTYSFDYFIIDSIYQQNIIRNCNDCNKIGLDGLAKFIKVFGQQFET